MADGTTDEWIDGWKDGETDNNLGVTLIIKPVILMTAVGSGC